eukprot:6211987-Pleurochrysis_carterae.AAC.3
MRKEHNEVGQEKQPWRNHHNEQLYLSPGVISDMEHAGVDGLHLIFLNAFKLLLNYTLHQGFPLKKLKHIKVYTKKSRLLQLRRRLRRRGPSVSLYRPRCAYGFRAY